jgi:hypothetical protein
MKKLVGYDVDDVLDLVGLERQRPVLGALLPAMGLLALGAAIGAGIGLMLAPSSGRRLRKDVGDRIDQIRERMLTEARRTKGEAQQAVQNATTTQQ